MTGFARLIVVFCLFFHLALSMKNVGRPGTTNSSNENPLSAASNRVFETILIENQPDFKEEMFKQKLDHFDNDNDEMWDQRYFVVDEAFQSKNKKTKKKLPVFLMIGGQRKIQIEDLTKAYLIIWNFKFSALSFLIEHRFYGGSIPINNTETENLRKYLNVGQALGDYAHFIESMTKQWGLTSQNKWILFGGGYAGTLTVFMKFHYPELVSGLVASSAYFPKEYFLPDLYENAGNFLKDSGPKNFGSQCHDNIRNASISLSRMFDFGNLETCNWIKLTFFLNSNFDCTNSLHVSLLFLQLASKIVDIIRNRKDLETLCKSFTNSNNKLVELAQALEDMYSNDHLFETTDYERRIEALRQTSWDTLNRDVRVKYYQQCTELGGFQVTETYEEPFIFHIDREFMYKFFCTDIFDLSADETETVQFINFNYYRQFVYDNVVFTVGTLDFLLNSQLSADYPNSYKVIQIKGAFHCEDMSLYNYFESNHVANAQSQIGKLIKKWI